MEQNAIRLNARKRHEGRDGDFEAKQRDEFFNRLREHLVGTERDPRCTRRSVSARVERAALHIEPYQKRAESTQAVFSQPEDQKTRLSML